MNRAEDEKTGRREDESRGSAFAGGVRASTLAVLLWVAPAVGAQQTRQLTLRDAIAPRTMLKIVFVRCSCLSSS